jgi:hypothetical protein
MKRSSKRPGVPSHHRRHHHRHPQRCCAGPASVKLIVPSGGSPPCRVRRLKTERSDQADAQKVVILSRNKAKTQTYCDMTKLVRIEQANEKRDHKMTMSCRRNWHWEKTGNSNMRLNGRA